MNTIPSSDSGKFSLRSRMFVGGCALCLVALLGVAASLTPSPRGFGTHEKLGLPPCTFRWLMGMRCPSCGMTTSWSHLLHGEAKAALASNVGGVLLAAAAVLAVPLLGLSALRGRWVRPLSSVQVWALVALVIAATTLLDWVIRLSLD